MANSLGSFNNLQFEFFLRYIFRIHGIEIYQYSGFYNSKVNTAFNYQLSFNFGIINSSLIHRNVTFRLDKHYGHFTLSKGAFVNDLRIKIIIRLTASFKQ